MAPEKDPASEPVELAASDPSWAKKFESEKAALAKVLGVAAEIHHIGSTAVAGLKAKPVIDILVAVDSIESPDPISKKLSPLGYTRVPHEDDAHRLFFRKGSPREFHVHVVKVNSWTYWRPLLFRDILRSDPAARQEYTRLKEDLATKFRDDRVAYTDGKGGFIDRMVAERVRKR